MQSSSSVSSGRSAGGRQPSASGCWIISSAVAHLAKLLSSDMRNAMMMFRRRLTELIQYACRPNLKNPPHSSSICRRHLWRHYQQREKKAGFVDLWSVWRLLSPSSLICTTAHLQRQNCVTNILLPVMIGPCYRVNRK